MSSIGLAISAPKPPRLPGHEHLSIVRPSLRRSRIVFATFSAAALAGALVLFLHDPTLVANKWYPPCLFHSLTGWYCPGCGSTRGMYQLLHGHLSAAFAMNPLIVLCIPYFAYAYLAYAAKVLFPNIRCKESADAPTKPMWIWSFLALVVLFWVARNLPVRPFTLLAPH